MTKKEKIFVCITLALFIALVAFIISDCVKAHRAKHTTPVTITTTDTVYVRDTLVIDRPVEVEKTVLKTVYMPVTDTLTLHDTFYVAVNRVQKRYEESTYKAYVSGIDPALDSLVLYPETRYVNTMVETVRVQKQKRWGVGVTAGYGISTSGFVPYIGIGLTYNIVMF